ncbi:hypothetical protein V3W47_02235 [Deinococcus sp. YIM 134068]|uniref:hypothetical protein n=1 Tax=Deinococcus lichenicola TaxID=3118910 RepID=UPI002F933565
MTAPPDLEDRLRVLEERVEALEGQRTDPPTPSPTPGSDFWALDTLTTRHPQGAVLFSGHARLPTGERYGWQDTALTPDLLAADWGGAAPALAALGHPLRLALLRAVLHGQRTTAEFQARPDLAGAGKLYHHLRELQAAGWLSPQGRGRYMVPAGRVVSLLVILRAAGLSGSGEGRVEEGEAHTSER